MLPCGTLLTGSRHDGQPRHQKRRRAQRHRHWRGTGSVHGAHTQIKERGRWGNVTEIDKVLIRAVTELYDLLEHETRRIDNELTQEVTGRGAP